MILVLLIIVLAFTIIYVRQKKLEKCSSKVLWVFLAYWFLSLIISVINPANYDRVSFYTYLLCIINVLFFTFGFCSVAIPKSSVFEGEDSKLFISLDRLSSNKVFVIILLISSLYVYSLLVVFWDRVLLSTLADVRNDFYEHNMYGPAYNYLRPFLLKPMSLIGVPLFGYMILYKRNIICALLGFFLFGVESLGGGRIGYVKILLGIFFVGFCLFSTFRNNKKKGRRVIIIGFAVVALLLSFVSALRTGITSSGNDLLKEGGQTTVEHVVGYSSGSISAFDYALKNNYVGKLGGYSYGQLTFSSLVDLFNIFGSKIGIVLSTERMKRFSSLKQDEKISLGGESTGFNALYTAVFVFYSDFGILGVLFLPFFFGRLFRWLLREMYRKRALGYLISVSATFFLVVYSVLDYGLYDGYELLALLIIFFTGKVKVRKAHTITSIDAPKMN